MDIKLKNFSRSSVSKFVAFILVVASVTWIFSQVMLVNYKGYHAEAIFTEHYYQSSAFESDMAMRSNQLLNIINGSINYIELWDFYYYALTWDHKEYSNIPNPENNTDPKVFCGQFSQSFMGFENWGRSLVGGSEMDPKLSILRDQLDISMVKTAYIAIPNDIMAEHERAWLVSRNYMQSIFITGLILFVLSIALIIYLILVTGRKPVHYNDDGDVADDKGIIHLNVFDRIYLEFQLVGAFFSACLVVPIATSGMVDRYYPYSSEVISVFKLTATEWLSFGIFAAAIGVCTIVWGAVLLSIVRKLKAKQFWKLSLCGKMFSLVRSVFDGSRFRNYSLTRSLYYRQLIFLGAITILIVLFAMFGISGFAFGIIITPLLGLIVYYLYVKGNNKTYDEINKGFNASIEDQIKAERMKVALITNVSHDLKTPLTSIISYVDLLSKEENLSETARDYVTILGNKSERLKHIVADLFDLAKSTSGDLALDLEKLDMKKLIEQTIADMSDKIEQSNLVIKSRLSVDPIYILADGKKMYRVFQNIIDNALKYSLYGSRIYIDLEAIDGKGVMSVKSTAGYEMDFTPEEILQRFSRGDESRSGEGSGLGLSIAESFTQSCGGNLKVDIDGDLFKVTITFDMI